MPTADFNTIFVYLFIAMFAALGVTDMVEAKKESQFTGQPFFGLMFIIGAIALILYKIKSP